VADRVGRPVCGTDFDGYEIRRRKSPSKAMTRACWTSLSMEAAATTWVGSF